MDGLDGLNGLARMDMAMTRLAGLNLRLGWMVTGLPMMDRLAGLNLRLGRMVTGMPMHRLTGESMRLVMVVTGLPMYRLTGLRMRLAMVVTRNMMLDRMPRVMRCMVMRPLGKCKRCRGQDGECCQYVFHCFDRSLCFSDYKSTEWILS